FRAVTRDLSASGVRVVAQEAALLDLPAGASLHLQILLPSPHGVLNGDGVIRNVVRSRSGEEVAFLCLAFDRVGTVQQTVLERFLASCGP
ncbi:MAG: PilZ domain-containing protein, partial [Deltaproteobacteria bacterium]|nr:PilZ domain-containing protein [Deltaproteobacteria bacterium]